MRFFDLLSLIVDNLGRRKGRVALTAVGVIIGTASVVILVSLANGLQRNATSQLYGVSDLTTIYVYPGMDMKYMYGAGGGGGGGGMVMEASDTQMLTPDVLEQFRALPGVSLVMPRDRLMGESNLMFGKLSTYPNMIGTDLKDLSPMDYKLQSGTLQLDKGSAIIGGWVVKNFYDPNMRPGQEPPPPPDLQDQQVRLMLYKYTSDGQRLQKTVTLRVAGVLAESRGESDGSIFVRMEDLDMWNQWMTGQRPNRYKNGYQEVIVRSESADQVIEIADQINQMGFMANTPQSFVQSINSFFLVLQLIFGGVGAIALLVAAIGIANTMTMAILERTKEIGLMKAVGATNRDVLSIFLGEAAGIGFLGGLGGVLGGWGSAQALNLVALSYLTSRAAETGAPPPTSAVYTPLWLPLFALAFATVIGLLSGLYPALRAASLVPVMALKYE